ncbi:MAG: site-specific integrase, partial [Planctomycetota bacterium]
RFDENRWYEYGAWLKARTHKQGTTYQDKTRYTTLTVCKQVFNFGIRQKLLAFDPMPGVHLPKAKARPQVCPTTEQVTAMLALCDGITHAAIAIMAFQGLRVGEVEALQWADVQLDHGEGGMLHVRRGAATGKTKTKQERFVPIHPTVRRVLEALPRSHERVVPGLKERTLLSQIKRLGKQVGLPPGVKCHSMRHHFASMCANSRTIPYRMAMQWLGHSSSQILDLYYHLHDNESQAAMRTLAEQNAFTNTR